MPSSLLHSQTILASSDPSAALRLSQQASAFLQNQLSQQPQFPISLFAAPESPELWTDYERLLLACLRTGDDKSAHLCLERLTTRFGPANERIMALRGLYQEAIAVSQSDLEKILQEYEKILADNPVNVPIMKRRIALLGSMSQHAAAISALVEFLDAFPTDAEAWCELADLYQTQGMSSQAIFSLEEALLIVPNAWNLHARLGELEYVSTTSSESQEGVLKILGDAVRRFCRSIELCDDYLRGYYGLQLSTRRLLDRMAGKGSLLPHQQTKGDDFLPSRDTLESLHDLSTRKLAEIVKSRSEDSKSWEWHQSELVAAQELLEKGTRSQ